jgi:hypothetical protein
MVDGGVSEHVGAEAGLGDGGNISVVRAEIPSHYIVHPIDVRANASLQGEVVWEETFVVVSVELPSKSQLTGVVEAINAAGAFSSSGQGRQQNGCQNSNDGYDCQEFEHGKRIPVRRFGYRFRRGFGRDSHDFWFVNADCVYSFCTAFVNVCQAPDD